MRLSDLKGNGITKKLQFINGEVTLVEVANNIDGEINFFALTVERLTKINDEVVSKMVEGTADEEFMFMLIPYVCDIEVDINYDEFLSLLARPSKGFTEFVNAMMICLKDLFAMLDSVSKVESSANELIETAKLTNDSLPQQVESVNTVNEEKVELVEESVDEQIDKLYEKLSQTADREERNKLIKRITILQG